MSGSAHYGPGDLSVIWSNGTVTLANARGVQLQTQNPLIGYRLMGTSTQNSSSIPSQTAAAESITIGMSAEDQDLHQRSELDSDLKRIGARARGGERSADFPPD
jgi:hypothetical protein